MGLLPGLFLAVLLYFIALGYTSMGTNASLTTTDFLFQIFNPFILIFALGVSIIPLIIGALIGYFVGKKAEQSVAIVGGPQKTHIILHLTIGVIILGCFLFFWYGFDIILNIF